MADTAQPGPPDKAERHQVMRRTETEIGALLMGRVASSEEEHLTTGRLVMGQLTGNSPVKGPFYGVEQDDRYLAAVRAVHAMLSRAEVSDHPESVLPTVAEVKTVADSRVRLSQSAPLGPPSDTEHVRLPSVLQAVLREMREAEGDAVADGQAMATGVLPSERRTAPGTAAPSD